MYKQQPMTQALPHDLKAEEAVLGSIFLKNDTLATAMTYLKPRDFYSKTNAILFHVLVSLANDGERIDAITVQNRLAHAEKFHKNLYKYIGKLAVSVPTVADMKYYCKIVEQKSLARRLILSCRHIIQNSYKHNSNSGKLLDNATSRILSLSEENSSTGLQPLTKIADESLNHLKKVSKNKNGVTGEPTGYTYIDRLTTGLHPGEFIVIAARPAMGKTTIALNIARNLAQSTHKTVAIFSLEMSSLSLADRMFCAGGNIDAQHLRQGNLTAKEMQRLVMSIGALSDQSIYIDDTPGINVASILARSKRLAKKTHNLGLIVIDYLQLVEGIPSPNRQQVVSMISRQLKKLAKELNVPVIALSQLSRSVEQREDKRPVLSDLRESGSIEQDADIVAFLYRKDYYQHKKQKNNKNAQKLAQVSQKPMGDPSVTDFIVRKNRSGPGGTVKLMFLKAYNKFANIAPKYLINMNKKFKNK